MPDFGEDALQAACLAARLLGWRPGEFWQATPHEFATALREPGANGGVSAPSREQIAQLMERDSNG